MGIVFDQLQRALGALCRISMDSNFGMALVSLFGAVSAWLRRREV